MLANKRTLWQAEEVFKRQMMKMKKKKSKLFLIVRFSVVFIIASILVWMIIAGGCFNFERVKLHNGNTKIDISGLFIVFKIVFSVFLLTASYILGDAIGILVRKKIKLFFVPLLI